MKLYAVIAIGLLFAAPVCAQQFAPESFAQYADSASVKAADKLIAALMPQGSKPQLDTLEGKYYGVMYKYGHRQVRTSMEIRKVKNTYRLRMFPKPSIRISEYYANMKISKPGNIIFSAPCKLSQFNSVTITRHGKYLLVRTVGTEKSFTHRTNGYFLVEKKQELQQKTKKQK